MFLGKRRYVDLVDRVTINKRIHSFWWVVGVIALCIICLAQRYVLASWYQPAIDTLEHKIHQQTQSSHRTQQQIDALPNSLPEQHQHRRIKLFILLKLLQQYVPDDMRVTFIHWPKSLRIEGESKAQDTISNLRAHLIESGYFSDISLEKIRQTQRVYQFTLLIIFAEDIDFSMLAKRNN